MRRKEHPGVARSLPEGPPGAPPGRAATRSRWTSWSPTRRPGADLRDPDVRRRARRNGGRCSAASRSTTGGATRDQRLIFRAPDATDPEAREPRRPRRRIAHDFNNLLMVIIGNTSWPWPSRRRSRRRARSSERRHGGAARADLTNQMLAYSGKGRFVIERSTSRASWRRWAHLLAAVIAKNARVLYRLDPTCLGAGRRHPGPAGRDEPDNERLGRARR